VRDFYKI